jgi:drug/metabolite transporter (DMT)-like permease
MSSLPSELTIIDRPIDIPQEPSAIARVRGVVSRWWIAFMASSIFVVSGHLLIKAGLNAAAYHLSGASGPTAMLHTILQPAVIIGLATYCFGSVCWIIAVAQQEISFLYPLSSINYVLVVVASSMLFRETISFRRGAGVGMIVLGMVLINRVKKGASQ